MEALLFLSCFIVLDSAASSLIENHATCELRSVMIFISVEGDSATEIQRRIFAAYSECGIREA